MGSSSATLEAEAREICAQIHCRFEQRIAAGAFKETFRVSDASGLLALKLLKPGSDFERIVREVDAARSCTHSNISPLLDVGVWGGRGAEIIYFLEPFLTGGTLTGRLGATSSPSPTEVRQWALRLGEAIAHLEGRDLVHRDLKPDNIMFGRDPTEPVLVDFGIARHLHEISLTPTWAAMGPGTPLFTSPEQINNQKALIDWRSDQFSLGVVLSQCLIGRHPYQQDGDSQSDIVDRVMRRDGPSPAFLAAIQDYQWLPVVRMVQPWNHQRYRFPTDMLSELQTLRS